MLRIFTAVIALTGAVAAVVGIVQKKRRLNRGKRHF